METWKEYLNKFVKVIYDDGGRHPSKKEGIITGYTDTHLILNIGDKKEAILLSRILRVETNQQEVKSGRN